MSGEIEAMGALTTAGLAADALDRPAAGEAVHGGRCANCDATLAGAFCSQCGQKAHFHRTLGEVFHDFLHGITHLDGKAWKTLPMLLFRPGRLTRDYIEGRRARYVAPVPLFLMVVFLMFFVLSFMHVRPGDVKLDPVSRAEAAARVKEADKGLADIDRDLAVARAAGNTGEIAALQASRATISGLRERMRARAEGDVATPMDVPAEISREISEAAAKGDLKAGFGVPYLDDKANKALKNPDLVLYKLQSKAYKLSFLLVPMSLPWLWLIFFWRRGVGMYDHAIFALYSISFMSLLFIIGSLALTANITVGLFWFALIFIAPVAHMFVQLKGAYALSSFSAGWRTAFLLLSATSTLAIYLVTMIALGVLD